jgi:hypothetical protein
MPTDAPACAEPGTDGASPSLAFLTLLPSVSAVLLGFTGIYAWVKMKITGPVFTEGALGSWFTKVDVILKLNEVHGNFRQVFFAQFRALLDEPNHAAYVRRMADYVRLIQSKYMFVRVERPRGSKRFVLAYVKCERVFSFASRYEQLRLRLSRVPPRVLREVEENEALRLACVGETNYERALTTYRDGCGNPCLNAALRAKDKDAAEALLDGGENPNYIDGNERNALHMASWHGCRLPFFHRLLGMIKNVNAGDNRGGITALMRAAENNHLDMVTALMSHPGIDLNATPTFNDRTALHRAVHNNHPAIVAQLLSDDRVDSSADDESYGTPLEWAIVHGHHECVRILREHGAPEPSDDALAIRHYSTF